MGGMELGININDAYRYMGGVGEPDDVTKTELLQASEDVLKAASPRVITRVLDIKDREGAVCFEGSALRLEGRSIAALLNESESAVLFCATIGNEIEALLRRWQLKDMVRAAMLDACASAAVEDLCEQVNDSLAEKWRERGFWLTERFSPGYGDLPLSVQRDFCAELDTARKLGLCVSGSGIMIPRKSVTAIIGISKRPQPCRRDGCENCEYRCGCKFRESGVTCYGQAL